MPASSAEARARWSKRKREYAAARKYKLKESDNSYAFKDSENDDDPDVDPLPNHLDTEDDPRSQNADRITHMSPEKGIEKLGECGLRICEFPVAIKRVVISPHLSVFEILEAERAARMGERRVGVRAALENISYGQLQALSSISRDNPVLSGVPIEETASGSGDGSYVITPPRIAPGSGVIKRLWSAGPVHVVPVHSGNSLRGGDFERKFHFKNIGNPVMCLVAFLASAREPRVAAACAHESLAALSKDGAMEWSPHGDITNSNKSPLSGQDAEGIPLSAEKVLAAANYGLSAVALKAKLFADHEECEIQLLSARVINHQLKRLELKLKQFAEAEILLMRECEQMKRTRQRIAAERSLVMSAQFGSTVISQTVGLPVVGSAILNGNSMQQIRRTEQPLVSRYHNNQPLCRHLSPMQLQGMYGLGPRVPVSSIQASSSGSDIMFDPSSNSPSSLAHQMLGSLSGTKYGLA